MPDDLSDTPADDSYPHIDAKDTDRQLNQYYSNSFTRYSNFEPLAKGGSAILQTCRDDNLGRTVVMKILHPHLAQNEYMKARFLREARVTAQLQHPATVPVYEIGHDIEGRLYFTMKKVEGITLREILDKQSLGNEEAIATYNLDRMLGIIIQTCNALHYAHVHGVVHRDVKPENILVGEYGEVILLDWGVAKVWANDDPELREEMEHEVLTDPGQRPGTPLYMSPEQIRGGGDNIDGRTDVYGIGAVLYEVLTLKEPHRGENINETFEMILNEETIPPEKRTPDRQVPKRLSAITMKALEKQPVDRYQTMQELIAALRDFRSRALQSLTVH
jgi:eukaryotic-like serine/threonine-protein kinase